MNLASLYEHLDHVDEAITRWLAKYGLATMRIALGIVFFWFGVLKFSPGASSAEQLAGQTIQELTLHAVPPSVSLPILATWECLIGLGLITGLLLRFTLLLLIAQMLGTVAPLFIFPEKTFVVIPFLPTLEGQYIIKNVVLITAAMVIGATVRGGKVVADPDHIEGSEKNNLR
jgi:uncharacterized membrane protein YphA (DoxX/SURF4 family)